MQKFPPPNNFPPPQGSGGRRGGKFLHGYGIQLVYTRIDDFYTRIERFYTRLDNFYTRIDNFYPRLGYAQSTAEPRTAQPRPQPSQAPGGMKTLG